MLQLEQELTVPAFNHKAQFTTTMSCMVDSEGADYVAIKQDTISELYDEDGDRVRTETVLLTREQLLELAELVR